MGYERFANRTMPRCVAGKNDLVAIMLQRSRMIYRSNSARSGDMEDERTHGRCRVDRLGEPYRHICVCVGNIGVIRPPEPVIHATGDFP